jgi:hypothetical protein
MKAHIERLKEELVRVVHSRPLPAVVVLVSKLHRCTRACVLQCTACALRAATSAPAACVKCGCC